MIQPPLLPRNKSLEPKFVSSGLNCLTSITAGWSLWWILTIVLSKLCSLPQLRLPQAFSGLANFQVEAAARRTPAPLPAPGKSSLDLRPLARMHWLQFLSAPLQSSSALPAMLLLLQVLPAPVPGVLALPASILHGVLPLGTPMPFPVQSCLVCKQVLPPKAVLTIPTQGATSACVKYVAVLPCRACSAKARQAKGAAAFVSSTALQRVAAACEPLEEPSHCVLYPCQDPPSHKGQVWSCC